MTYLETRFYQNRALYMLVDPVGFEPTTFSMPLRRAPNCAMGPVCCIDRIITGINIQSTSHYTLNVDLAGFEPATSSVRLMRAPNCATGPTIFCEDYTTCSSRHRQNLICPEEKILRMHLCNDICQK